MRMTSNNQVNFVEMTQRKRIAIIAHDNKKPELIKLINQHREELIKHELHATATTGSLLEATLGVPVIMYKSSPVGGDQQIGAKIAEQSIDLLIFLPDPHASSAHNADVKVLTRLTCVWNIPMACNISTANFLLNSPYMSKTYNRTIPSFERYLQRDIKVNEK